MRTENVTGCGSAPPDLARNTGIEAFLAKVDGGVGIEELILQDTQAQRRAGKSLRKVQREQRRRLVEQAVKKMKDAADDRFHSGLLGALSGIAGEVLGVAIPGKWSRVIGESAKFLGGNLAKHFIFDVDAVEKETDAKLLQEAAQAKGDAARDTGEWLASARELERRMIDRMEQMTRSDHESRMSILNRIGS
jgi:hypothetical protein